MSKSECLICCNPMDTDVSSLICIHKDIFHEECLNKWGKGRCPLCRANQELRRRSIREERKGLFADIPEEIINRLYENYSEKMISQMSWLIENSEEYGMSYEISMISGSITSLTEEDYCFIKTYNPEEERGFMWSNHPVLERIKNKVVEVYPGHSGSSLGWTLRAIQYLVRI